MNTKIEWKVMLVEKKSWKTIDEDSNIHSHVVILNHAGEVVYRSKDDTVTYIYDDEEEVDSLDERDRRDEEMRIMEDEIENGWIASGSSGLIGWLDDNNIEHERITDEEHEDTQVNTAHGVRREKICGWNVRKAELTEEQKRELKSVFSDVRIKKRIKESDTQ